MRKCILMMFLLYPSLALALECPMGDKLEDKWKYASHVFLGTVKSSEFLEVYEGPSGVRLTIEVSHFYKGEADVKFYPLSYPVSEKVFFNSITSTPIYTTGMSYIFFLFGGRIDWCQYYVELHHGTHEYVQSQSERIDIVKARTLKRILKLSAEP